MTDREFASEAGGLLPELAENARVVLEKRYLLRDESGVPVETPELMFRRIAGFIAEGDLKFGKTASEVDALAESFYELLSGLSFLPNSPTLMNAGKPNGQLSACFVLPVPDSLEGIFDTLKHAALIHQSGGGTGFSFSRLRPKGDRLRYTSGVTSGPVSFMRVYNAATEAIKQGGTRRGANMGILRIDHPDIEEFITLKNDLTELTNFNISVAVTDAFMQAVEADAPFDLVHPNTRQVTKTLPARDLLSRIVESAWRTGEPGLIFIDRINAENVTPGVGDMESTNPCGEVPLLPYEACNLGSINLVKMLMQTGPRTWKIDWDKFERVIHQSVHFLDNVITQNTFPLAEVRRMVEGNRKIGLGLMGWADALYLLSIPYDSEAALRLADQVVAFMNYHSKRASVELAKTRGRFPFFDQSVYVRGNWFSSRYGDADAGLISRGHWQMLDDEIAAHGLRNATTMCLAPTGTISIIAGVSGGIEPVYAVAFKRNILEGTELLETDQAFHWLMQVHGCLSPDLLEKIVSHGGVRGLDDIPEDLQAVLVTAHDIEPRWHLAMQAAFQRHSDNAVSKTINFQESAAPEQIAKTYTEAYRLGLKGITVYRDNSRLAQPMARNGAAKTQAVVPASVNVAVGRSCPECGQALQLIEGCHQCPACQYAYCG